MRNSEDETPCGEGGLILLEASIPMRNCLGAAEMGNMERGHVQ